jgi:GNAT superfamily N-acetyltransferase
MTTLDVDTLVADLNGFRHGGIQPMLVANPETEWTIFATGKILDQSGTEVGDVSRQFTSRDDHWVASHRGLWLEPQVQGRGFGLGFQRFSETVYRRAGIKQVSMSARDIGAYAWHTEGFRLAGPPDRRRQHCVDIWNKHGGRERAQAEVTRGRVAQASVDAIEQLFGDVERAIREPLEPDQIAALDKGTTWHDQGRLWSLGRVILTGAQWEGVKEL